MTQFDPEKITFFAKTDARGQDVAFGIKAKDRQRHMYVVGKTGMGKSTLLENMAAQDIQNGEGMAFIDPHGSAAETLLNYVPEHRVKDVVYFAPFDLDNPISFNVMEDTGPETRHLVVSGLMSTFKKVWVDAWSARMEYILTNALAALIEYPDTTLLSVNRLFSDDAYRKKVVDYIQDPSVKSFWLDEFAGYTDRFKAEALPAIQNKIGQFTGNPLIRNIIGQPHSSFDIRQMMDEQKILIMNLSKGLIGETNANLLGSMLTTRIYLAAMSRANLPPEQMKRMPNFYFYVDEFQSFANSTFANILSEARKYHLNLIIAHQYIDQMEEDVRSAVFGNVGTTIAFRVGPFDAEVLETVFAPRFMAVDLVNLGFAQIYLTLMIDGIGSQPFSAKTLGPVKLPPVSCRDMVVASSRELYASPRAGVEKLVAELHTPERKPEKFDRRATDKPKLNANGAKRDGGGGFPRPERRDGGERDNNFSRAHGEGGQRVERRPYEQRPDRSEQPRVERVQKSPEDLRNILAQMTSGAMQDETDRGTKPKSNSVGVSVQEAEPKHEWKPVEEKKEVVREVVGPAPAKPAPDPDLKQALASALGNATQATSETKTPPSVTISPVSLAQAPVVAKVSRDVPQATHPEPVREISPERQRGIEQNTPPKQPTPDTSLADLVAKLQAKHEASSVTPKPEVQSAIVTPERSLALQAEQSVAEAKPVSMPAVPATAPATPLVQEKMDPVPNDNPFIPKSVAQQSQVRKIVVEHRKRYRPDDFTIKPKRDGRALATPVSTSSVADNVPAGIDPTVIKRMLRPEQNERSPFN